jgi:nucleoside triphosphate pyrophosphatase
MRLVLASASPRRADLLRAAGFAFDVDPVDVDEAALPGERAAEHVRRLALAKAAVGAARHPDRIVLGCDTVVALEGRILGKPRDIDEARRMLRQLSGREHDVLTGVALRRRGTVLDAVEISAVRFAPLADADVDWLVASGEADDKAGAYAIQGLASRFIDGLTGSYSNVVGLPVSVVHRLLGKLSTPAPDERRRR